MHHTLKKIFYNDSGYPIERNLLNIPFERYQPIKKIGLSKVLSHIHYKLLGNSSLLSNSHLELFKKKNGIWHFFNGISFGKTPWVVTYETALPRWFIENDSFVKFGVEKLAGDACKRLIAISECTKNFQYRYLEEQFPAFYSQIISKITVIHPPQPPLISTYNEKNVSTDTLVFTFIGSDFFRKGGKEILLVFERLFQKGAPIELNIISSLRFGDYASNTTAKDLKKSQKIIRRYPDKIHHFETLSNKKVLEILKKSHIGLLPTYADTYGYSVLEAQAAGCPVITTNIRALPEINNDKQGWIIDVSKDRWGNGVLNTAEARTKFSQIIIENLFEIISDIISNPTQIRKKGIKSINHIRENHNPEMAARQLEQIYDEALNR